MRFSATITALPLSPVEDARRALASATLPMRDYGDFHSKASQTLDRLRSDIISAELKPGEKLSFNLLTERYEVGISPLREALCQLVGHGLVILQTQRGFRVASVSAEDLADVVAIRRHIEIYGLGLSIGRGDARWRNEVRQAVGSFKQIAAKVGDPRPIDSSWQDMHRNMHFALISACGSPVLLQFFSQIYDRFDRYRRLAIPRQSFMAGTAGDHDEIAAAAIAGDQNRAAELLQRHLDDIAEVVLENFSTDPASWNTGKAGRKSR